MHLSSTTPLVYPPVHTSTPTVYPTSAPIYPLSAPTYPLHPASQPHQSTLSLYLLFSQCFQYDRYRCDYLILLCKRRGINTDEVCEVAIVIRTDRWFCTSNRLLVIRTDRWFCTSNRLLVIRTDRWFCTSNRLLVIRTDRWFCTSNRLLVIRTDRWFCTPNRLLVGGGVGQGYQKTAPSSWTPAGGRLEQALAPPRLFSTYLFLSTCVLYEGGGGGGIRNFFLFIGVTFSQCRGLFRGCPTPLRKFLIALMIVIILSLNIEAII